MTSFVTPGIDTSDDVLNYSDYSVLTDSNLACRAPSSFRDSSIEESIPADVSTSLASLTLLLLEVGVLFILFFPLVSSLNTFLSRTKNQCPSLQALFRHISSLLTWVCQRQFYSLVLHLGVN